MMNQGNMAETYKPGAINQKRRAFLKTLASEHQDFYNNPDRFIIQNASLSSGKGNKSYARINFIPQTPKIINIYTYEGDEDIDDYTRSCIHAYALSILYVKEWQDENNPQYADMLGCVITILATYTFYKNLKESGLEKFLKRCNMEANKVSWTSIEEVKDETKDTREAVALEMGLDNFDSSPQSSTIVALSTLILIGKNVTDVNRDGWFRNRWRGLANIATVLIDADRLEPPVLRNCQALYSVCAANQPIRSCLFKVIRSFASITNNENHIIFDRIVRLLQWSEMSHMWMIIDSIFCQHPDILNFSELRGPEISAMSVAISFLKRFPYEDRAYLKLLYDHNDLIPLHSQNFIHFTAAAHAIASLTKTSMLNINTRFSENVKEFQERVKDYIQAKSKIGPISAAISFTETSSETVRRMLIKSIEGSDIVQDVPDFEDRQPEVRE
ncbi:putative capsid [Linepithema humile rhabdo-like virus 1]|uniref:Capsid n=1 Tax=Linepithema humile rhabdo-like virus 1 TaxID=2259786 RepID=A0AAD0LDN9_9MONO|nr:putative capsid [Linepithema humile rhabdo-like virus 1]AXA52563.1 putative capsid [Linepithema humile rhabdo-like virus 1]UXD80054.1 putative capsid protein [Linepithema humile rhabdo-like virus 1]